jgi:hypothetical protein
LLAGAVPSFPSLPRRTPAPRCVARRASSRATISTNDAIRDEGRCTIPISRTGHMTYRVIRNRIYCGFPVCHVLLLSGSVRRRVTRPFMSTYPIHTAGTRACGYYAFCRVARMCADATCFGAGRSRRVSLTRTCSVLGFSDDNERQHDTFESRFLEFPLDRK